MRFQTIAILCTALLVQTKTSNGSSHKRSPSLSIVKSNLDLYRFDLEKRAPTAAQASGYFFGVSGAVVRSYMIAAMSQLNEGEFKAAAETYGFTILTLGMFDLGQNILANTISNRMSKIFDGQKADFAKTLAKWENVNSYMTDDLLADAKKMESSLKVNSNIRSKLKDVGIINTFADDLKNSGSHIAAELVKDLDEYGKYVKGSTVTDVLLGPLFDIVTIGLSAHFFVEAVKADNKLGMLSNGLGFCSGLSGLAGFMVSAAATSGTALATFAGPVGAILGAILGLAQIGVDVYASHPMHQIAKDLKDIKKFREATIDVLELDRSEILKIKDLKLEDITTFDYKLPSKLYVMNQAMMVKFKGTEENINDFIFFKLPTEDAESDVHTDKTYLIPNGKKIKKFDSSKYPPSIVGGEDEVIEIGYDFYGLNIEEDFTGAMVVAHTKDVRDRSDLFLKGMKITTFNDAMYGGNDIVILGSMGNLATGQTIDIKTGPGNDIFFLNGIIGKIPEKKASKRRWNSGNEQVKNLAVELNGDDQDALSLAGMVKKNLRKQLDKIEFDMGMGNLFYGKSGKRYTMGKVLGARLFVGSPFDDTVTIDMKANYHIYQRKGNNKLKISDEGFSRSFVFESTFDDKCPTAGKIDLITSKDNKLIYVKEKQKLVIYLKDSSCWKLKGRILLLRGDEDYNSVSVNGGSPDSVKDFEGDELTSNLCGSKRSKVQSESNDDSENTSKEDDEE